MIPRDVARIGANFAADTRTAPDAAFGVMTVMTPRTPRQSTPRQNLYAATMLVPLAAIAVLAGGKIAARHTGFGGLVQTAQAQQAPRGPAARTAPATAPAAQPAATPPVSTAPAAAASAGAGSAAVAVLLEQANYWRNQQQYDQAVESLKRALALDPRNSDALALTGMIEADRGNRAVAENALTRLRSVAPGDPRIDKIDQSLRVGAIPQEALTDARRLARDGRQSEAVDRYNRVFRGNPPPDRLSVEYYQTLAGTEGGWEPARDGLARVVRQNPQDLRAQLAYAQILTYREGARADGIARLAALSKNQAVAEQATAAWRQALGWLPDNKAAVDPITVYLNAHPNDAPLANKLEAARNPAIDAADPTANDRIGGFDALNKNRLGDAAKLFQKSIDANPNDADAIGGLGIVKLRQRSFAEAKTLLGRAIALDPEHSGRWQPALNGANQATSAAAAGGRGGENASAAAQALLNRGDFPAAERELQRQIARNVDRSGGLQSMLADAQAQQGKLGDAEGSYRDALSRNPRSAGALVGLAGVLSREGRSDEAQGLLAQAESLGAGRQVGQARALALRQQAQEVRDPATQSALFREAVGADPTNPWLRLDLARSLVKLGQVGQARSVMAEAVSGSRPSNDALKAGIIFANETSDPDAASALIARLPPGARTADMRVLQQQAGLQREIGTALLLSHPMAKQRLLEMASGPDPDGSRGAAIARALSRIGEKAAARDALLVSRGASGTSSPGARLAYAGAFLDIGATQDAEQTLRQLGSGAGLTPQQRQDFAQLQAGLAVRSSDQLNQKGRQADGYDVLAPALASTPDNPALNMALARLYEGAKKPREALEINEGLLRRDPDNQDARRAAIDAAIAAGNRGRADELVQEGLRMHPNDPKAWIASAELAKARGNTSRALRDYQHARDLRMQQLGYSDNGNDASTLSGSAGPGSSLPGVSLVPGAPANYAPVTPRSQLYSPGPRAGGFRSPGNPDGGADDSTLPPDLAAPPSAAAPNLTPPSSAPPNLYPEGATPAKPRAPFTPGAVGGAPNYEIRRGRMLDTSASDLPPPNGAVTTVSTAPAPVPASPSTPVASVPAIPAPSAPAPSPPTPLTTAAAPPPVQAPALPPSQSIVQAAAQYTPSDTAAAAPSPEPAARYQTVQSQPAPAPQYQQAQYQQAQYQPSQYQPSPAPQYQQPQYSAPQYQAPQYQAPQYQAPQARTPAYAPPAASGGYRNIYQPTVPPDAMYQPQIRGYLPQYQPAAQATPPAPQPRIVSPPLSSSSGPFGRVPSVLSDTGSTGQTGYYNNPFRRAPAATAADSDVAATPAVGRADAVTEEIDRNIISLRDEVAPSLQAGVGFRSRSGDSGLDKLAEFTVPIEAEFSPGGTGRVKLTVTPTQLTSGTIAGSQTNLARFGTSALGLVPGTAATNFLPTYTGAAPGDQNAQGVALDASYVFRNLQADVGTTPIGFKIQNIVGGIEYAPKLTDNVTFRMLVERRAITDSILAYGGTVDSRTGIKWGGETRDRAHGNFELSSGLADFYLGGGAGNVRGTHVPSNTEVEFGAGGSYPVYRAEGQELRVGLDLVYFGYNKNLGFFTLGQGGYFSPQSYTAALIPIIWRETVDEDLKYEVGVSLGFQTYHEKETPYFPLDPGLQANLVAQQTATTTTVPGVQTSYPAQSKSGFAGSGHAQIDYRVAPNLHVGGKVNFQHSGNFDEASGLVYARYLFNGTRSQ